MAKVKVFLLMVLVMFCAVCSAADKKDDADSFWSGFRQAVLDNDKGKVMAMTQFPFVVRGPDDSDPAQRIERKDFAGMYERLVAQPVFFPSDDKIVSKSMRELIGEKKALDAADYLTSDSFQIHQFEFQRINGRWQFTRAYLEE